GETAKCELQDTVYLPIHERVAYEVSAQAEGKIFEYAGNVISYSRKVLAEEATATTCSWCIRGVVMMDRMERKYPDRFISLSAHMGDVMAVDGYIDNLNHINARIQIVSIPNAAVNRTFMCDPENIEVYFRKLFNEESVLVAMKADAVSEDGANINVTSQVYFAEPDDDANYRLAYYIVEDSVYHPNNPQYKQQNAYSGSGEDWDGYEKMGTIITDMRFRNVVRGYNNLFDGVDGSIPNHFVADEEIIHSYSLPIPETIDNLEKCHIVVMLIDMSDHRIVNACTAHVKLTSAIKQVKYDDNDNNSDYEVIMLDGRIVAKGRCLDSLLAGRTGIYLIKKGPRTHKVIL
ncbi:MAG: Omp28-related outer membrane protein, partial [Muribaculaceae bacterium]